MLAPEIDQPYELGLHRPTMKSRTEVIEVETTIFCGGTSVATFTSTLDAPLDALHLGTVRFSAGGTCSFTPSDVRLQVLP